MLYLDFNEPSGVIVFDSSGNGNDGQLLGATRVAQGISGGGVSLDGNDDLIEVPEAYHVLVQLQKNVERNRSEEQLEQVPVLD